MFIIFYVVYEPIVPVWKYYLTFILDPQQALILFNQTLSQKRNIR